ncbi:MAG: glycoside hydrolase family 3 C-terminal domain-containing protein [Bifidobacteriaceae bacterium]|jgi:beta-glucosidase-like glycosyl hydrolase/uncharacterized protein YjdB|nr:glycoside hydrolase family 3 C-terminal domain-containing protein [Bifidobacteriaceae bacterium]
MKPAVVNQISELHLRTKHRWRHGRVVASLATAGLALSAIVVPLASAPASAAAPIPVYQDDSGAYSFEERAADLVSRMTLAEKLTQFSAATSPRAEAIPRLGVRAYRYWNEALHGVARNGEATSLPTGLGIGATWDVDLVREGLATAADEARAYWNTGQLGYGLTYWSPTINMGRDPRWGRAEESFGEDPHLMGEIAGAFVDGLQSDDPKYLMSVATVKHFAANNNENNRHADSSDMSQKDLREYYLPAFQTATEEHGVASLMTAYNSVNGTPMPANEFLVKDVLRRTWGFDGFITSDCGAIDDVGGQHNWTPPWQNHQVTRPEATAYSLKAGTDIDCAGGQYTANLGPALEQGLIVEDDVDIALARMFTIRMRTGEFESTPPWPASHYSVANEISAPDHLATAQKMSEDAIVLLKNEPAGGENAPILPLPQAGTDIDNVVVAGTLADEMVLGDYSADLTVDGRGNCSGEGANPCNHALFGVRQAVDALGGSGASVQFVANNDNSTLDATEIPAVQAADVVIVVVGTRNGDSTESRDRGNLNIPRQQTLANEVLALNPRTVVYISSVAQVNIEQFRHNVPAILWSTYNGQRQGTALGRVLWAIDGTNPSARLPFTWYTTMNDLPGIKDYNLAPYTPEGQSVPTKGRTYQYFTGTVSYPFGHGLSYSDFTYSNLRLDNPSVTGDDTVTATVTVQNTTAVPGRTVVQLYASSPVADGITRPWSKLVAFDKIALRGYQSKDVHLQLEVSDLWYWDEAAQAERIDLGKWTLKSGASVDDAATSATLTVYAGRTRTLQQVRALPTGVVLDLDEPGAEISAMVTAAANDQSFYDLSDPDVEVVYSSSNPAVATVSRSGVVRGVADGVATITATVTAEGTTASDSFAVAVTHEPPLLESLMVDGVEIAGFDPELTRYTFELASPTDPMPVLTGSAAAGLTVTVDPPGAAGETGTVTVSDTGGGFTTYSVRFMYYQPFQDINFANMTPQDFENAGWSIVNESPVAWTTTGSGLQVTAERGDVYEGDDASYPPKNQFVHDASGSWVATVPVRPEAQMTADYQQAYIGVRQDNDNYVKLAYQHNGSPHIAFVAERNGSAVQNRAWQSWPGDNPSPIRFLRLMKDGTTYTGYWSPDGSEWFQVFTSQSVTMEDPQFMLGAFSGRNAGVTPVDFTFERIDVEPLPTPAPLETFDFRNKTFPDVQGAGWWTRRDDGHMTWGGPEGVEIQSQAGDLYEHVNPDSAKNLVGHSTAGDWAATLDIGMDAPPAGNYQKVAMFAWADDDNFVYLSYQYDNGLSIELSVETGATRGQRTMVPVTASPPPENVQLRLEKLGNEYRGFYSFDNGGTWEEVSSEPVTFTSPYPQLMFSNYAYGTGTTPTAQFKSVTVGAPSPPPPPPTPVPFESIDLRGKTRVDVVDTADWSIVRESAGAIHWSDPAGLVIDTQTGGLWGGTGGAQNIFTHSATGNWTATMHLLVANVDASYEQALIGMYANDSEYIKLTRSSENGGQVQWAVENGGNGSGLSDTRTNATDLYLRLVKFQDTYAGYFSTDGGVTYEQVGAAVTKVFAEPRFMFATYNDQSGGAAPNSVATFTDLNVSEAPVGQIDAISLPAQQFELSAAQAGVTLASNVTVSPNTVVPDIQFALVPMDINTAGATVTPEGVLTATRPGRVRVRINATAGFDSAGATGLIEVIADGSGSLSPVQLTELETAGTFAHVGEPVTVVDAEWSVVPDSVTFQWLLDGVPIPGATGHEYIPVAADAGHTLSVEETATHAELGTESVVSGTLPVHAALVDTTALNAAIEQAQDLLASSDPDQFTVDSWTELSDAIAEAILVSDNEDATAAEVQAALAALQGADLVPRGNIGALEAAIAVVALIDSSGYTQASWAAVQAAVDAASALVAAPGNVTVAQADQALADINQALADLEPIVPLVDVGELSRLVDLVDSMNLNPDNYTASSWVLFANALAEARAQAQAPGSQVQVNQARTSLANALASLVLVPSDSALDRLDDVIATVQGLGLNSAAYTRASWTAFQAALVQAAAASTPAQASLAIAAVQASLAGLVPRVDRGVLAGAVDSAAGIDLAGYTPATGAILASALASARGILAADPDQVTRAAVDQALLEISAAITGLEVLTQLPDDPGGPTTTIADLRRILSGLVSDAASLAEATYSPDTWAPLAAALLAGRVVAANPSSTQGQVEAAITAISRAMVGLKPAAPAAVQPPPATTPIPAQVIKVKAGQSRVVLVKGKSVRLAASAYLSDGSKAKVSWKSSKKKVATVAANGRITAKRAGKATITLTNAGKTAKVKVTVLAKTPAKATVKTVSAARIPKTMAVGAVAWAAGKYSPARATGVKVSYRSSTPGVVAVDSAGRLVAKTPGKATITVKAGSKSKRYTVTVTG